MNTIIAEKRNPLEKVNRLRKSGILPCVICGKTLEESILIQIKMRDAKQLLRTKYEGNKTELELDGKKYLVVIQEISQNTIKNEIQHISFKMIESGEKSNCSAHIILKNRDMIGGYIEQVLTSVPYCAYPEDMFDSVTIDIAKLPAGNRLTVGDVSEFVNEKLDLLVKSDANILLIKDNKRPTRVATE